jgi:hypothetical protein
VQRRHFFEAVIRENLDLGGRPDRVRLLFPCASRAPRRHPPLGYRTRVITDGVQPSLHVEYKSSHVKQYFKEQHALRTETTICGRGASLNARSEAARLVNLVSEADSYTPPPRDATRWSGHLQMRSNN